MQINTATIIITAAGSPIGHALAVYFATLGAKLALIDSDATLLQQTQQACLEHQQHTFTFPLTDTDPTAIQQLFGTIYQQLGTCHVLINTWPTATPIPHLLHPNAIANFHDVMCHGATTFFAFGKIAALFMQHNHDPAVIINLALNQSNNQCHLPDASKAIIRGLTQSWAKDLEMLNIRVGGILPLHTSEQPLHHQCVDCSLRDAIVTNVEYIIVNDSFNGRMLETEVFA